MVTYIRRLAVRDKGWLSDHSFAQGVAICQTIPGATAMQAAAYAGLRAGGGRTALAAYCGFGLPAFVLMLFLAVVYRNAHELPSVTALLAGVQVMVVALVANATWEFGRQILRTPPDVGLAIASALFLGLGGNPVWAVPLAALAGLWLHRRQPSEPARPPNRSRENRLAGLRPPLIFLALAGLFLLILSLVRPDLVALALLMAKIDLFAFGGGFASVPLMVHEVVEVHQWLDSRTLMDGIGLGQVTPGPIVITATFAGALISGLPGALAATFGIFTPSFIILLAAVPFYDQVQGSPPIQRGVRGILAAFVGLLLSVTVHFALKAPHSPAAILIGLAALTSLLKKVPVPWVMLAGGLAAILVLQVH